MHPCRQRKAFDLVSPTSLIANASFAHTGAIMYSRRKNHLRVHPGPRAALRYKWFMGLACRKLLPCSRASAFMPQSISLQIMRIEPSVTLAGASWTKWWRLLVKARGRKNQQLRRIQNLKSSAAKLRDVNVGLHEARPLSERT